MDKSKLPAENARAAMVFAGGLGLGSYHAGAYERLQADGFDLDWLAGSSVGAITAALLAGNAPAERIARLREFWTEPNIWQPLRMPAPLNFRHGQNWMSAIQTRLFGAPGHFRPRTPGMPFEDFRSLYDLAPMRRSLEQLVDFARLNSGEPRLTVATTDIETGQVVLFDTAREKLTIDHLMASCGMLPEFAPVTIDGRLLGDGGLAANAPFEPILADTKARLVFVLDLFARDGDRPRSFAAALARKNELMFGNQTLRTLEFWRDASLGRNEGKRVVYLSYRASADEADAEKLFDLSARTVDERWRVGTQDMAAALLQMRAAASDALIVLRAA
jgi:NTE family protein